MKMPNISSAYDSIRELDEERRGNREAAPEMSIVNYMVPPTFWELGSSLKMEEEVGDAPFQPMKVADRGNRIRVKNINTGVSFEFTTMINAARFLGVTDNTMRYSINDKEARVYLIDGEEYVFTYDDEERPIEQGIRRGTIIAKGMMEVVSSTGERTMHYSYLSVARQLGLLIRHVMEEEKRAGKEEKAKNYMVGKEMFTLEFGKKEREKYFGRGIRCHWKGIYDKDGDWEKISRINVTSPLRKPIIGNNPY